MGALVAVPVISLLFALKKCFFSLALDCFVFDILGQYH